MTLSYAARLTPDEDGKMITFRDLPEAISWGGGPAEIAEMAEDVLLCALESRADEGEAFPHPSRAEPGERLVHVSAGDAAKLRLRQAARARGLSDADLAERLGVKPETVRRLLSLRHPATFQRIERGFAALNMELIVEVRDAA